MKIRLFFIAALLAVFVPVHSKFLEGTCHNKSCTNGGECVQARFAGPPHHWCLCPSEYSGARCELTPCPEDFCDNDGVCERAATGELNDFYCKCPIGFEGRYCEDDVEDSVCGRENPCGDFGRCILTTSLEDYRCECMNGYKGANCTEKSLCPAGYCNRGTCSDESGHPECHCPPNFSGDYCEHDVDECQGNPCHHGGFCMNKFGTFECHCPHGTFGVRCEFNASLYLTSEKNCTAEGEEACLHGGICRQDVYSSTRSCYCPPMYQGTRCELDVNECDSTNTCMNGGTCLNYVGGFQCICPIGFEGEYCEVKQICDPDPCQAGGHCVAGNPHACSCPHGRVGQFCEHENICLADNPCTNGGTCSVDAMTGNFTCQCPRGYKGRYCHEDVDECADGSALCYNNGSCVNIPGSYKCACPRPYAGRFCEEVVPNCRSKPCKNNGFCLDLVDSYKCRCPSGYEGEHCERKAPIVLICKQEECLNGGRCKYGRCVCAEGFQGPNCTEPVKPRTHCLSNPCQHGFCQEEGDDYRCHCYPGYTGRHCEMDVDNCKRGICGDSGVCIDGENSYTCSCKRGFTGRHCEEKIDIEKFIRTEMRDKELCQLHGCAALAGNGRCDQECNHFACGFDGGDCSAKAKPYERCPTASYCTRVFHDGNCDEICNNEACLFDGFDCSGSPSKCQNATFCEKNYGNGRCDPVCNNTACGFDGGDCETPEVEEKLNGEVVLVVLISPADFRRRVNQFLMTLGGALRSSVTIRSDGEGPMVYEWKDGVTGQRVTLDRQQPLSVNFLGVVRGRRAPSEQGVIVWLSIDVTNCRRDCFSDISTVADFLGRAEAKQELEDLGMPIKEARVARRDDGTGTNSNALLAAGSILASLLVVLVVFVVVTQQRERTRKRKMVYAPTWMPPTDSQYKMMQHQAAEISRHQSMHSLYHGEDIYSSIKRSRLDVPPPMPAFPPYADNFSYPHQVFLQPQRPPVFPELSELHEKAHGKCTIPLPLIVNSPDLVNARQGHGGVTPLLLVARSKNKTVKEQLTDVENLFNAGAYLDAQNEEEQTALFIAAKEGRKDLVRRLLELGANPCKMDKQDSTPLHQAANNGDLAVVRELLNIEAVRKEINQVDKGGKTALMCSAFNDILSTEVAAALIEAGADPSFQGDKGALSYRGRSAVHYAAQYGNLPMLRFLLEKGANKDGQDLEECTPLILAVKNAQLEAVSILVAAGASQDISDQTDNTPRTLAISSKLDSILEILDKGRKNYNEVPLPESKPVKVPVKRQVPKRKQQPLTPPHSDGTSTPPEAFQLGRPLLYSTGMDSPSSEGSSNKTSSPTYHQLGATNAGYTNHSPPYDLDWTNGGLMPAGFMPPLMQQTFTSDYQSAGTSFDTSSFHLGADMNNTSNSAVWNN